MKKFIYYFKLIPLEIMINIQGITKKFKNITAVDNVSFNVRNGEIVGLVGLNGAGKTTTIRVTAGVLIPNKGDVIIDGYSVLKDKKKASANIGWVPELPIFELDFKAIDYFVYISGFYGYSASEAKRLANELFQELELSDFENKKLETYSQGMKKRFALAVSLISNPNNFLFDEVLNGLDVEGIAFFRNLALKFKKEGKAVLFSSHILKEVENLADRVVFIHKGKIIDIKTMDEIKRSVTPQIIISIENMDNNKVKELLSSLKLSGYEINGNNIVINEKLEDKTSLLQAFISAGLKVSEMKENYIDLEEYFFKIIGERR